MEYMKFKHLPWWCHSLFILLFVGATYHAARLVKLASINHAIANPERGKVDEDTPEAVLFAKALWLEQNGKSAESIRLYSRLRNTQDLDLRSRALHNLATIYLIDGARHWHAHGVLDYAHVSTQVELAKEYYREALRLNPDNWDARYNLEYAWRITPPPKERPKSDFTGSKSSVYSTLPGLPGGGP